MENEIDKIIDYLRLNRITEEFEKTHQNTDIGLNILTGNSDEEFFIEAQQRFEDFSIYNRLVNLFDALQVTHLYLSVQGNNITYFIQRTITNNQGNQTFEYRNILNTNWSAQNDSGFIKKPVNLPSNNYFYNTELERVVIKNTILQSVLVTNDTLMYDPQEMEYISNGKYNFDYEDHGGNRDTLFATVMKAILGSNNESREILFKKEESKKYISIIPTIKEDRGSFFTEYPFTVTYPYLSKNNGMFSSEKSCLSFSFKSISTFLEFLNQTIILEPNFDFDNTNTERRKKFKDDYVQIVADFFKKKLENTLGEMSYREALMLLHYLPEKVVMALPKEQLWLLLKKTIAFNTINNRVNLDEEDLVIKLLKCIGQIETNKTLLLNKLLSEKSKEESYFKILYDSIHGDNFIKFTQIIQNIWKKSNFIIPSKEQYPDEVKYGPMFLPYESEKTFGLYFSNADISFSDNSQEVKVDITTKEKIPVRRPNPDGGGYYTAYENKVEHYVYHPFYPIYIENSNEQETEIKFDMIVPAFLLKANEDKEFWHNAIKTGEYALDVVTTLSGVGNLAKFRYLAQVVARAETLSIVGKTGRAVAAARKSVAATAAVIEISSGSIGTLLKLTGLEDTVFGKALYEYLFWLELLSLSGELTVAIHNGLRKSAKEILEHEDELRKTAKNADEVNKIEEALATLKKIASEKGTKGDITKSFFQNVKIALKEEMPLGSLFGQTRDYTCASNALKMLLDDFGFVRSEEYLADLIKTVHIGDKRGANILDIAPGMKNDYLDSIETITRGGKKDIVSVNALEKLLKKDGRKAIVSVATDEFGAHAVVVDKIENGRVFLRDPLPLYQGSSYSVSLEDFKKVFNKKFVTLNNK
jgi:hypothetical protein